MQVHACVQMTPRLRQRWIDRCPTHGDSVEDAALQAPPVDVRGVAMSLLIASLPSPAFMGLSGLFASE